MANDKKENEAQAALVKEYKAHKPSIFTRWFAGKREEAALKTYDKETTEAKFDTHEPTTGERFRMEMGATEGELDGMKAHYKKTALAEFAKTEPGLVDWISVQTPPIWDQGTKGDARKEALAEHDKTTTKDELVEQYNKASVNNFEAIRIAIGGSDKQKAALWEHDKITTKENIREVGLIAGSLINETKEAWQGADKPFDSAAYNKRLADGHQVSKEDNGDFKIRSAVVGAASTVARDSKILLNELVEGYKAATATTETSKVTTAIGLAVPPGDKTPGR